jgi:hypothetical protein
VQGAIYEGTKLSRCILMNRKAMGRPYTWFVTICIEIVQTPKESVSLWTKVCRALRRRGIVALWLREPTRRNKIHYHLLIRNAIKEADLRQIINEAMPDLKKKTLKTERRGWHFKPQQIPSDPSPNNITSDEWTLCHYISKAKLPIKDDDGRIIVEDRWRKKRLLFKPNLGLKKVGTIGPFWQQPRATFWEQVKDQEKRIGDGLARPGIHRLVNYIHDMIGGRYATLTQIERSLGYNADDPVVTAWAESLLADEWVNEDRY